jgi:bifunctional NMN adenylyltransferase/nudix hydrolase
MSYDLSVFIGRFQPPHLGHFYVAEKALQESQYLTVLIGSSDEPRDFFNPFTFDERKEMFLAGLAKKHHDRVFFAPILDYPYNDDQWSEGVQKAVRGSLAEFGLSEWAQTTLIGHSKDHSSYYLKKFPQWSSIDVPNFHGLSATPLRDRFFNAETTLEEAPKKVFPELPKKVSEWLVEFSKSEPYANMVEEFDHIRNYKKKFAGLPFKPIFTTVDAVVIQSGHVLMVQRRSRPGTGLWALPGGFLEAHEWIDDAVVRELMEETSIKVPEKVIRGSFMAQKKFDHPYRSTRGRTITFASVFKLPDGELPKIKGQESEVKKVEWIPLANVQRSKCYEDHYHVVKWGIGIIN